MATVTNTTPPQPEKRKELVVTGHSNLFYWWPVWLLGFVFAALTYFRDAHMALVPADAEIVRVKKEAFPEGVLKLGDPKAADVPVLVSAAGKEFPHSKSKQDPKAAPHE